MSVQSMTAGYSELCGKSHEFLRRACTYSPKNVLWAGDIVITEDAILKQSEVSDMRGEASEVRSEYSPPHEECSKVAVGIPPEYKVEETDIRTHGAKTFQYAIPKNPSEPDEQNWDLNVYQSLDDCGNMMDGGDALQRGSVDRRMTSLCGTIVRSSGAAQAQAHYLDNRKSFPEDPDNGLLIAMRTGFKWNWEIRYAPVGKNLGGGLELSDDVSTAFRAALALQGMTDDDVLDFGMI